MREASYRPAAAASGEFGLPAYDDDDGGGGGAVVGGAGGGSGGDGGDSGGGSGGVTLLHLDRFDARVRHLLDVQDRISALKHQVRGWAAAHAMRLRAITIDTYTRVHVHVCVWCELTYLCACTCVRALRAHGLERVCIAHMCFSVSIAVTSRDALRPEPMPASSIKHRPHL
jgi:hypothetical protein